MLAYIRNGFALIVALLVGYFLGNGPFAEWVTDVGNWLGIMWATERASRGPGGTVPLLVAGFLLGQGLFLLIRTAVKRIQPLRAERIERLAVWDPTSKLGTRFGLFQYLEHCSRWAAEDPTTRTQTLVLFKICGLGALNETVGTVNTTLTLRRIADELRAASLPDSASAFKRWRTHYFPRPATPQKAGIPVPRYPARWSGATFALAFRELDAVQAVAIARDLSNWIRKELESSSSADVKLTLSTAVAVGSPGVTGRGLGKAAANAVVCTSESQVRVLCDPADVRANVIAQMSDVVHQEVVLEKREEHEAANESGEQGLKTWLRQWGPGLGCLIGAMVLLQVTGSKVSVSNPGYYAWPEDLREVQQVDAKGVRTVHLVRAQLPDQQSTNWKVTNVQFVQGRIEDGVFPPCQLRVTVTNQSTHRYYVSSFDFTAVDAKGVVRRIEAARMLRMVDGLAGQWVRPGDTITGRLLFTRGDAPIGELRFEPDRLTRMAWKAL